MRCWPSCCRCGRGAWRCCCGSGRASPSRARGPSRAGCLGAAETLEDSIRRHLAAKVDVRELSHLEQLETLSDPERHPGERLVATAYLGLVPAGSTRRFRRTRPGIRSTTCRELAFDYWPSSWRGASACAPSSLTRTSALRSRRRRSRSPSSATSTAPRSATTCRRRTCSACCFAARCSSRPGSCARRAVRAAALLPSTASATARSRSRTSSRCYVLPAR